MSSFTSPLIVSPMHNGRNWRLERSFTYRIGKKYSRHFISVPKGFVTDFASIPKLFWLLPYWAKYNKSPVLHDWLYQSKQIMGKPITRKKADSIFLEAMLVEWRGHKLRCVIALVEYCMVRLFGEFAWYKRTIKKEGAESPPPLL